MHVSRAGHQSLDVLSGRGRVREGTSSQAFLWSQRSEVRGQGREEPVVPVARRHVSSGFLKKSSHRGTVPVL